MTVTLTRGGVSLLELSPAQEFSQPAPPHTPRLPPEQPGMVRT